MKYHYMMHHLAYWNCYGMIPVTPWLKNDTCDTMVTEWYMWHLGYGMLIGHGVGATSQITMVCMTCYHALIHTSTLWQFTIILLIATFWFWGKSHRSQVTKYNDIFDILECLKKILICDSNMVVLLFSYVIWLVHTFCSMKCMNNCNDNSSTTSIIPPSRLSIHCLIPPGSYCNVTTGKPN